MGTRADAHTDAAAAAAPLRKKLVVKAAPPNERKLGLGTVAVGDADAAAIFFCFGAGGAGAAFHDMTASSCASCAWRPCLCSAGTPPPPRAAAAACSFSRDSSSRKGERLVTY